MSDGNMSVDNSPKIHEHNADWQPQKTESNPPIITNQISEATTPHINPNEKPQDVFAASVGIDHSYRTAMLRAELSEPSQTAPPERVPINTIAELKAAIPNLANADINVDINGKTDPTLAEALEKANLTNANFNGRVENISFKEATMTNVTFNNSVTNSNFEKAMLFGATFNGDVQNSHFIKANLPFVTFNGSVAGSWFFSASMPYSTINGDFHHNAVLNAGLAFATFNGTVSNNDFAFSKPLFTNFPSNATDATQKNVFTGTSLSSEPLLSDQIKLNDPNLLQLITNETDSVRQADSIRQLAANGQLYDVLSKNLPPGTLDKLLPGSFRSAIYDELQMQKAAAYARNNGIEAAEDIYWAAKQYVFDAADGRYSGRNYVRPDGGPTLDWLYNNTPEPAHNTMKGIINNVLADALLTNNGRDVTLADPFQGRVSPNLFGIAGADKASTTRTVSDWLNSTFDWNGRDYQVRDITLPSDRKLVDKLKEVIIANGGTFADLQTFDKLSRGYYTLGDLEANNLTAVLDYLKQNANDVHRKYNWDIR